MPSDYDMAVRLEGGIGDVLLGNRFVPAILEKYPEAKITAFVDCGGKKPQVEILQKFYSRFYLGGVTEIPNKKYENFKLKTQLGEIDGAGFIENTPDSTIENLNKSFFKWYDLHIDSLKWTTHDYDWIRYFRFFPRPTFTRDHEKPKDKNIILHLYSHSNPAHRLDEWYAESLVKSLAKDFRCTLISDAQSDAFCEKISKIENVEMIEGNISQIIQRIDDATMMISIDSGLRYLAYGLSKPVITLSSSCKAPHAIPTNIFLRWMLFPESTFPINYNYLEISRICRLILNENEASIFVPAIRNFDKDCQFYRVEK